MAAPMTTATDARRSTLDAHRSDSLIRLDGVKKVFFTEDVETHALSDVHLEIRQGEYVAIGGPSGCGKTTLLSILGLLDTPSGGKYELAGQDVTTLDAAERRQRVHAALEKVGMSHRQKHYPAQLSGGQQQRVAVARAVVGDPAILMADEPTGNLDSANGESVMELLQELHRGGATVCMVTHDPRYAQHAQRTIHLFDGRVVEETTA
jgi:putative ABC transport system ATP-binding protein